MAGYKKSLMSLKPDCFLTFDGELYDVDGYLRTPFIPDMTSNENHAYIHTVPDPIKSYSIKTPSLVDREYGFDQASFTFASRGYLGAVTDLFPYPGSKLEVFHSDSLRCEDEFTISFIFQKAEDDVWFKQRIYNPNTGKYDSAPTNYREIQRTIFQKGNDIWMRWRSTSVNNLQYLDFKFPGTPPNNTQYTCTYSIHGQSDDMATNYKFLNSSTFHQRQVHVVMTREKLKIGAALYQTVDRVYIDGNKMYERFGQVTNEPSTGLNTSSIMIGGNTSQVNLNTLDDRQTSPLYIDNFAVWQNRCLTDDQVSWLYKKIYDFTKYTTRWDPYLYIGFDETSLVPNVVSQVGRVNVNKNSSIFNYIGYEASQILPGKAGPKRLITAPSVQFQSQGMARITSPTNQYTNPVIRPLSENGNYTLEFFIAITSRKKGVILSCVSDVFPYKGILIEANCESGKEKVGSLQVTLEDGLFLNSNNIDAFGQPVSYSDGEFHHICIIRRDSVLEFWIDGVMHGSRAANNGTIANNFGQMYLMGSMPENNSVDGNLAQLVFFQYAMQPSNIRARSYFYVRTVVEGYVTLRGVPHPATVRCFERTTGKFITEAKADQDTGWYKIDVWSQNYMDVMYFDIDNPQVRPRALGPYLAYEYTDIDDTYP